MNHQLVCFVVVFLGIFLIPACHPAQEPSDRTGRAEASGGNAVAHFSEANFLRQAIIHYRSLSEIANAGLHLAVHPKVKALCMQTEAIAAERKNIAEHLLSRYGETVDAYPRLYRMSFYHIPPDKVDAKIIDELIHQYKIAAVLSAIAVSSAESQDILEFADMLAKDSREQTELLISNFSMSNPAH